MKEVTKFKQPTEVPVPKTGGYPDKVAKAQELLLRVISLQLGLRNELRRTS